MDPPPPYPVSLDHTATLYYPSQYPPVQSLAPVYPSHQPTETIYTPLQEQLYSVCEPCMPVQVPEPDLHLPPPIATRNVPISEHLATSSSRCTSAGTSTSSAHNSQQSQSTFKWLEGNFQFRSHVSISRSTIYELYQKFCTQNHFVPVCKATFGKIIRIKFPKVKSKRLGARGQSKYHYYNITFKDERKRCSMLLTSTASDTNLAPALALENTAKFTPLDSYHPQAPQCDMYNGWYQEPSVGELSPWPPHPSASQPQLARSKTQPKPASTNTRLTIFSNRQSALDSYSHFNLSENDYHAIIQSMLSYMRIPSSHQPLSNDKFVFINLYKIHCQCLIDSALSGNFAQMRHYLMHFWQQLPRHVTIYIPAMHSLDAHMYSLLEDIYLSSVDSPLDNLKRLNTIAYLIPVWLKKTFEYVPFEGEWWDLVHQRDGAASNVGEIKVEEADKWRYRIKFKVDFILTVKKINLNGILPVLHHLLQALDATYQVTPLPTPTAYFDMDTAIFESVLPQEAYINSCRATHHMFHQTQSLLWNTLLKQFRCMLTRLIEAAKETDNAENLEKAEASPSAITGQLLVDELDRLVFSVQEHMNQPQTFWNNSAPTPNHQRLYSSLSLLFVRLFDDLLHWLAVEQTLNAQDAQLEDEFVDEEEDEEGDELTFYAPSFEAADLMGADLANTETVSQLYLLLMAMQCYLMEICQTMQRKLRFGVDGDGELYRQVENVSW